MTSFVRDHWDRKYTETPLTDLGWYEADPAPSIQLIESCGVSKHSTVMDIGSGASTLIASLLELGYQNIYAVDISSVALEKAKSLLAREQAEQVHWLVEDVTNPSTVLQFQNIAVWHDRALFHFLTVDQHRQTYYCLLKKMLMPGGFVILATFALNGATKCSGLPVQRYDAESLVKYLGDSFKLIESFDYLYRMPSGDTRPYVYTRFQRI
jgi:2-polyprenyl-3-methyl-5-hydroxy-6-metoxy-1,4-benzoquinol methylase